MEIKHVDEANKGITFTTKERGLIDAAAGHLARSVARVAVENASGNAESTDQEAAQKQKAAANKRVQAIGAAVGRLYNSASPVSSTSVQEGQNVDVDEKRYVVIGNAEAALLEEGLQSYADATVDVVGNPDTRWSLHDYSERAGDGNDAAALAEQLHGALTPKPEA